MSFLALACFVPTLRFLIFLSTACPFSFNLSISFLIFPCANHDDNMYKFHSFHCHSVGTAGSSRSFAYQNPIKMTTFTDLIMNKMLVQSHMMLINLMIYVYLCSMFVIIEIIAVVDLAQ